VCEEGLMAFARVLREVSAEHDNSRAHTDAIQWDFSAQVRASNSQNR
jgi:hypothetical protein